MSIMVRHIAVQRLPIAIKICDLMRLDHLKRPMASKIAALSSPRHKNVTLVEWDSHYVAPNVAQCGLLNFSSKMIKMY
jgi:hypothetical protein